MTQLTYQWTTIEEALDEGLVDLSTAHWHEAGAHRNKLTLDVDWDCLIAEQQVGRYKLLAARDEGRLVGYSGWKTFYLDRHRTTRLVVDDLFYLDPAYRKGLAGWYLISKALEGFPRPFVLRLRNNLVYHNARGRSVTGVFMKRLGLEPVEVIYGGYLE